MRFDEHSQVIVLTGTSACGVFGNVADVLSRVEL